MTLKLVSFLLLTLAVFAMKRKRKTKNKPVRRPQNTRWPTPLMGKNTWSIVDSFLAPQDEKKFTKIDKRLGQFPTKYENISDEIKDKLFYNMDWLFFKHLKMQQTFAVNVAEKNGWHGYTPLHYAAHENDAEITRAAIEAGVDVDAKWKLFALDMIEESNFFDMTALCMAASWNRLEIGRLLIEAGADLNIECNLYGRMYTALKIAVGQNHVAFAEILRKKKRIK